MTVDMPTLREGDTVHFRCGGSAVISKIIATAIRAYTFCGYENMTYSFTPDGGYAVFGRRHLMDIIRITPRALTPEERLAEIAKVLGAACPVWFVDDRGRDAVIEALRLARGEP